MITPWHMVLLGVLAVVSTTSAQDPYIPCRLPSPKECEGCTIISDGVGYLSNPCNPREYLQCSKGPKGWRYTKMQCPLCTKWDQEECTCIHDPSYKPRIDCTEKLTEDVCKPNSISTVRGYYGQCRVGRKGQEEVKRLFEYDVCFYEQLVNNKWLKRPCPPGTTFSLSSCCCLANEYAYCPTSDGMCLEFHNGFDGLQTSNWVWVKNVGVQVLKSISYAFFDGNDHLEMPRYSNTEWSKFHALTHVQMTGYYKPQVLVDNGCCEDESTFSITIEGEEYLRVVVIVKTNKAAAKIELPIPYAYRFAWIRVVVYYSGQDLLAELWNYYGYYSYLLVKKSTGLKGVVHTGKCSLLVGARGCPYYGYKDYFLGYMDRVCLAINDEVVY